MFQFEVPGEPVAAARPRATFIKAMGRAHIYTPGKSSAWKATAAQIARDRWGGHAPLDEPVRVVMQFIASRPQRLLRKKDPHGRLWRTSGCDVDNTAKLVMDCLVDAGVLLDDKLVVVLVAEALYCRRDEGPSVKVWLELIGPETPSETLPLTLLGLGRADA